MSALDALNLKIRQGEIYAFIGANGTGKSTAINIMNGILEPTEGQVKIFAKNVIKKFHKISPQVGMAPQEYSIYLDLTTWENIKFLGDIYGMKSSDIQRRGEELLDILLLDDKRDKNVR